MHYKNRTIMQNFLQQYVKTTAKMKMYLTMSVTAMHLTDLRYLRWLGSELLLFSSSGGGGDDGDWSIGPVEILESDIPIVVLVRFVAELSSWIWSSLSIENEKKCFTFFQNN